MEWIPPMSSLITHRLHIAQFNAAGLLRSPDELINLCTNDNIDMIFLNETYLTHGRLNTTWTQYHNYALRPDNASRGFGGVSLLVRPDFPHHVHMHQIISPYVLTITVGNYTFHGCYFPPALNHEAFTQALHSLSISDNTIIVGDLNARLQATGDTQTNDRGRVLRDWLSDQGLTVWNASLAHGVFTFERNIGRSIIDFFISRRHAIADPQLSIYSDMSLNSDHRLCVLSFVPYTPLPTLPTSPNGRRQWKLQRLKDPAVEELYQQKFGTLVQPIVTELDTLLAPNPNQVVNIQQLEHLGEKITLADQQALDESVTRGRVREKSWKWFWNDQLQQLADQRELRYRQWRRAPDNVIVRATAWQRFLDAKEKLTKEIKRARRQAWNSFVIDMSRKSPNEINAVIKRMRRVKKHQ